MPAGKTDPHLGSNENFTKFDTKFSRAPQAAKFHEICAVTVLDPTYTLDITPHKGECGPHRHTRSYTAAVRDTSTRTRVACATAAADAAASASAHAHAPTHGHRTPPHTTRAHSSFIVELPRSLLRGDQVGLDYADDCDENLASSQTSSSSESESSHARRADCDEEWPSDSSDSYSILIMSTMGDYIQAALMLKYNKACGGLRREREMCTGLGLPLTGWCVGSGDKGS